MYEILQTVAQAFLIVELVWALLGWRRPGEPPKPRPGRGRYPVTIRRPRIPALFLETYSAEVRRQLEAQASWWRQL